MELVAVLAGLLRLPSRLSPRAQDSLRVCRGRAPSPVPAWGGEPERVVLSAPGRGRLDALRAPQALAASEGAPRALVAVRLGGVPAAREAAPSPVMAFRSLLRTVALVGRSVPRVPRVQAGRAGVRRRREGCRSFQEQPGRH